MVKLYLQDDIDNDAGVKLYVSHFDNKTNDYWFSYDSRSIIELTDKQAEFIMSQKDSTLNGYSIYTYDTGEPYTIKDKVDKDTYTVKEILRSRVSTKYKDTVTWEAYVDDRAKLVKAIEDHILLTSKLYDVEGLSINLEYSRDLQLLKYYFKNVYKYEKIVELAGIGVVKNG